MTNVHRYNLQAFGLGPDQELEIAARLRAGALAIYPTDTLYALGCSALDGDAINKLRQAKGREGDKPLPVIVADVNQARALAADWPAAAERLAEVFWPGPLTLVVPASSSVPSSLLVGARGIAMRAPGLDVARALARAAGPLVSTSANLAGDPPSATVDLALLAFPGVGLAIDVGPLVGEPSTIVDLTGGEGAFRILREGRVPRTEIESALGIAAS